MASLTFRDATPADAPLMAALGSLTFSETFGHLYTPENLAAFLGIHSESNWRGELEDARYAVRIVEEDGKGIGYAKLGPPSLPFETKAPAIELRQFYVLEPWQGRGVAAELIAWVLGEAAARGAEEIYLSVFVDTERARRFYQRHGFEPVGRYDFMVGSHADEDIVMRLGLKG